MALAMIGMTVLFFKLNGICMPVWGSPCNREPYNRKSSQHYRPASFDAGIGKHQ